MTVRELLARIDSRELSEWMAYYQLEPWGTETEDLRTGLVTSAIYNVNRDPKKNRRPFSPEDFVPKRVTEPREEQTWEEQARIFDMWGRVWQEKFEP